MKQKILSCILAGLFVTGCSNEQPFDAEETSARSVEQCSIGADAFVAMHINDIVSMDDVSKYMEIKTDFKGATTAPLLTHCYNQVTVRFTPVSSAQLRPVQDAFLVRTMIVNGTHKWQMTPAETKGVMERLLWMRMIQLELIGTFHNDKAASDKSEMIRDMFILLENEAPQSVDVKQ